MMLRRIIAIAVIVPVTLVALYRCTYQRISCSMTVATTEAQLLDAMEHQNNYGNIVVGRRALERLRGCHLWPADVDVPMLTALAYRQLHQYDRAIDTYKQLLTIHRRPEIYLSLGLTQVDAGLRDDGLQNLVTACSFAPAMIETIEQPLIREDVRRRITKQYGEAWTR